MGTALKVMDTFMDSGILQKFEQAQGYFSMVRNFMQDVALYVFANLLMDAILMMFHKQFS